MNRHFSCKLENVFLITDQLFDIDNTYQVNDADLLADLATLVAHHCKLYRFAGDAFVVSSPRPLMLGVSDGERDQENVSVAKLGL